MTGFMHRAADLQTELQYVNIDIDKMKFCLNFANIAILLTSAEKAGKNARPMPSAKSQPQPPANEPLYPQIEAYIERASADELAALFGPLKESLSTMKGPKADHAKKVNKAIERTEELLTHLLQVRERLEAERAGGKRKK